MSMRVRSFLDFGCKGSFGAVGYEERGHGDVLCVDGYASLAIADGEGRLGALEGGEVLSCVES